MMRLSTRESTLSVQLDQGEILRRPVASRREECRRLADFLASGDWAEAGIVSAHWDDDRGGLVQRCLRPNFPHHWTASMLKDAAVFHLDLAMRLAAAGYALLDALPDNIVFEGTSPRYVDLGSIVPRSQVGHYDWVREQMGEFQDLRTGVLARHFIPLMLMPLLAMSVHRNAEAREMLRDWTVHRRLRPVSLDSLFPDEVPDRQAIAALGRNWLRARRTGVATGEERYWIRRALVGSLMRRLRSQAPPPLPTARKLEMEAFLTVRKHEAFEAVATRLLELVARLDVTPRPTGYEQYYDAKGKAGRGEDVRELDAKQSAVRQLAAGCRGETWVDFGANTGWYTHELLSGGAHVVAVEVDEYCADSLFRSVRKAGTHALVLVDDLAGRMAGTSNLPDGMALLAARTFQSDGCLMLGLLHHLVLGRGVALSQVLGFLTQCGCATVLIEFIDLSDDKIRNTPAVFPQASRAGELGYSLENLRRGLAAHFKQVDTGPSDEPTRFLIRAANPR